MSEHKATVSWQRATAGFGLKDYNRAHEWAFDGGVRVPASSAPQFRGDADRVDPEEALVAALSSCHMLFFLYLCSQRGLVVDAYEDEAVGHLDKRPADGKLWMSTVTLHPLVTFADPAAVTEELLASIHHEAHEHCFIANSVLTTVQVAAR